jgi:hypothetical protein
MCSIQQFVLDVGAATVGVGGVTGFSNVWIQLRLRPDPGSVHLEYQNSFDCELESFQLHVLSFLHFVKLLDRVPRSANLPIDSEVPVPSTF